MLHAGRSAAQGVAQADGVTRLEAEEALDADAEPVGVVEDGAVAAADSDALAELSVAAEDGAPSSAGADALPLLE